MENILNKFKSDFGNKVNGLIYLNEAQKDSLLSDFNSSFEGLMTQAKESNPDVFLTKVGELIDSKIEEGLNKRAHRNIHPNAVKNLKELKKNNA